MAFYSEFADTDKVTSVGIVTSGIWQDGVSNILHFLRHLLSIQIQVIIV